jgi:SAM-dependent methyltransferase
MMCTGEKPSVEWRNASGTVPTISSPRLRASIACVSDSGESVDICRACGGYQSSTFDVGLYTYGVCGVCNSAWLSPVPEETASLYGAGYFKGAMSDGYWAYSDDAVLHRSNAADRLRRAHNTTSKQPTLLDVGCAYGYGLDAGRDAGWRVIGVELSDHARAIAQGRGHQVVATISEVPSDCTADLVVFSQVLEHLPDPLAVLQHARKRMATDGLILIETWNRDSRLARVMGRRWQQVSPPSVVHLFTDKGLLALLGRAGFADAQVEPWTKRISAATVLGIAQGKAPSFVRNSLRALAGSGAVARQTFTYRMGDLVLATGTHRPTIG